MSLNRQIKPKKRKKDQKVIEEVDMYCNATVWKNILLDVLQSSLYTALKQDIMAR